MSLFNYKVSLAYGSKEPPYGTSALPYHRGEDYPTPKGTPLTIGRVIGLTGDSGFTSGPHLHIQEWKGSVYTTRKPQNAFKGGTVVAASNNTNQQWGRHITVLGKDGWNTTYAHLDKTSVKIGQTIKEEAMCTLHMLTLIFDYRFGVPPDQKAIDTFVGKKTPDEVDKHIVGTQRYKDHIKALGIALNAVKGHLPNEIK